MILRNNNSKKKNNLKYNKETYDSLSLIEKITIKNQINKIIRTYKLYAFKKSVRIIINNSLIFLAIAKNK